MSAVGLGGYSTLVVRTGRTAVPHIARETAQRAIERLVSDGAAAWVPVPVQRADSMFQWATRAESREAARFLPFRDFRPLARAYAEVESLARAAEAQAWERRNDARGAAQSRLSEAGEMVNMANEIAQVVPLPRIARELHERARITRAIADAHLGDSAFALAAAWAESSIAAAEEACRRALPATQRFVDAAHVARWQEWIDETLTWSRQHHQPVIIVYKEKNILTLYRDGRLVHSYEADMGRNSLQAKRRAGDRATPEGRYHIIAMKDVGASEYHRALLLDYPNEADRERFAAARSNGDLPTRAEIGRWIEIHGEGGRGYDWTAGCVALSNADMDDLYAQVSIGTPVTILGGDGREGTFSEISRRFSPLIQGERP